MASRSTSVSLEVLNATHPFPVPREGRESCNLAIEDQAVAAACIPERLIAPGIEIDERKPRVDESDAIVREHRRVIGTAVPEQLPRALETCLVSRCGRLMPKNAKDSTHRGWPERRVECCYRQHSRKGMRRVPTIDVALSPLRDSRLEHRALTHRG